jgi:hypothetical protein
MNESESASPICILLTACIDTEDKHFISRADPKLRENDYIEALKKWMQTPFPLVFCENSHYDLKKIRGFAGNRAEILQFYGQDFPGHLGKGYGEMLAIQHAIENSELIKNCQYLVKVTGRYYIKNIVPIIDGLLRYKDTDVMVDLQKELRWADSYVIICRPSFIRSYFLPFQETLNDSAGSYFEHALAKATLRAVSDGYRWRPLPSKPIIIGFSGTSGGSRKVGMVNWFILELLHSIRNRLNRKRFE